MIYIYTVEHDQSVNPIMDWLRKCDVEYERINGNNFYHLFNKKQDNYSKNDIHWFFKWYYPSILDKFTMIEVEFPQNLTTNYGKVLYFSQQMSGTVEIITEDLRLIERFLNPIKSLIKR